SRHLVSCRHTMSGARSLSHATTESVRCLTELTFQVAMRMGRLGRWCNVTPQCPQRLRPGSPGWACRIKFELNPARQPPEGCTEFMNMLGETGVSKGLSDPALKAEQDRGRMGSSWR